MTHRHGGSIRRPQRPSREGSTASWARPSARDVPWTSPPLTSPATTSSTAARCSRTGRPSSTSSTSARASSPRS